MSTGSGDQNCTRDRSGSAEAGLARVVAVCGRPPWREDRRTALHRLGGPGGERVGGRDSAENEWEEGTAQMISSHVKKWWETVAMLVRGERGRSSREKTVRVEHCLEGSRMLADTPSPTCSRGSVGHRELMTPQVGLCSPSTGVLCWEGPCMI